MKCIYCDGDTKYKDRQSNGGRCGACKHPFAFEPYTDARKITDGLFKRLIHDVSGEGTLFFTERQLWYELGRRLWRKQLGAFTRGGGAVVLSCGVGCVAASLALSTGWPLLAMIPGVALASFVSRRQRMRGPRQVPISFEEFASRYLGPWLRAHERPARLLPPPAAAPKAAPRETEPDLTAYSFDRALVTEDAETAAMLVANNFHFENNCAILSRDGYPYGMAETVLTMLRRNPQLKVFALHDATGAGCALPRVLREERWFPDPTVGIIDLGLRPKHAQDSKLLTRAGPSQAVPPAARELLSPEEVTWLEQGNQAELAALRPARLMRAIYQGFARAGQLAAVDGSTAGDGGIIWFYDSGADVYAADSFG